MSRSVAPERTVVLSVGIERYAYGTEMDLPGAAAYAVRFAQWARGRGVPAERIWLGCSWLDQPADPPIPGARAVGCTRDGLDAALHELAAVDADLLLFYWCGHGLLDARRRRVLFTANATRDSKTYVPVDDIVQLMSSTTGTALGRQVFLIDACANFLEDMNFDTGLAPFGLERGRPREVEQFVVYSAEQGRYADYDRATRSAAFSTAALGWLEDPARRDLPPPMSDLAEHLTNVLVRETGSGDAARLPATMVITPSHGRETWTGTVPVPGRLYAAASRHDLTVPQVRRLAAAIVRSAPLASADHVRRYLAAVVPGTDPHTITPHRLERLLETAIAANRAEDLVQTLEAQHPENDTLPVRACWERQQWTAPLVRPLREATNADVRGAYARAVPRGSERIVNDLDSALEDLANRGGRGTASAPLYLFVAMLEHRTGARVADAWFELDAQQLATLRVWARERLDAGAGEARLVVDLRGRPGLAGGPWPDVVYWQLFDAGAWTPAEELACTASPQGVRDALQTAVDWAADRVADFRVGLVVSRTLQDTRPELWPIEHPFYDPEPLAARYPVVLHSGERMSERFRRPWRERLRMLRVRLRMEPADVDWVVTRAGDPRAVRNAIRDSAAAVIGLRFVPGPASQRRGEDPILDAVACGAPYVVWLEREPAEWDELIRTVDHLLGVGDFDGVPSRLFADRRDTPAALDSGLRLLWDDESALPEAAPLRGAGTMATGRGPGAREDADR